MHGVFEVGVIFFHIYAHLFRSRIFFPMWVDLSCLYFFPYLLTIRFHFCAHLFFIHIFFIFGFFVFICRLILFVFAFFDLIHILFLISVLTSEVLKFWFLLLDSSVHLF